MRTIQEKGGMKAEQVEIYQKASAPLRESFMAAKAARLQAFAGSKARFTQSVPASLLTGVNDA
jgi:hypothetical protein